MRFEYDRHTKISLLKSAFRIIGFSFMPFYFSGGIALLIIAELIGVLEETR